MKIIPVIEEHEKELKFTDEYGASMIVEFIEGEGERWVRVMLDNAKQEVRDFLEDYDEGVHMPLEVFNYFCIKTYEKGVENEINRY